MPAKPAPPRFALRFLRWFCDPRLSEDVEGDLRELFRLRAANHPVRARWQFFLDVLLLFRPGIIRNLMPGTYPNPFTMFSHHLKSAIRHAKSARSYTTINVLGLMVGMAACIIIVLWVADELAMDQFHTKSDRLYRVWRNMYQAGGDVITTPYIPQPLEAVLENEYPEVDQVTTVSWKMEFLFRKDGNTSYEEGLYVSPGFFQVFSFPFVAGDARTALNEIHSVVISEKLARKYFGEDLSAPIGQVLRIDERQDFKVTGVFRNPGNHSSLQFDWVVPAREFIQRNAWIESWLNGGCQIYLTLKSADDIGKVSARIEQEINKHTDNVADERILCQLFKEHYLHGTFENGKPSGGRIEYVRILGSIAVFMLLIACINFMNLSTARSSTRAREIGVRKVMGAPRASLGLQFFAESFLNSCVAGIGAITLVYLTLPYFNQLTNKELYLDYTNPAMWLFLLFVIFITGFLSGSYPSILLSSFRPVAALRGMGNPGSGGVRLRQALTSIQFGISVFLICGTIVVSRQLDFILNKDLGLNKENVIMLPVEGDLIGHEDALRTALKSVSEVQQVTYTSGNPLSYGNSTGGASWEGKDPDAVIEINVLNVSTGFLPTTGIQLKEGRPFDENIATDSMHFMINEVLARIMGFDRPVGQGLSVWGVDGTIIGVVGDFHMASMYEQISPLIIRYDPANAGLALIRTAGSNQKALAGIKKVVGELNPAFPFRYEFLDQQYARHYQGEVSVSQLLDIFSAVSIFISCLGLLGLSSFSADMRRKEIGIRKVLGAGVIRLILMLSRDYAVLMGISFGIAAPISYFLMQQWLNGFAFRMALHPILFFTAGLLAFVLGSLTVGIKSFRAASTVPMATLKEE